MKKKDKKIVMSFCIDPDLSIKVRQYCNDRQVSVSSLIQILLDEFLHSVDK